MNGGQINEAAENLHDIVFGDAIVNHILQTSRERWLTAAEWDLLFIEKNRFQIYNALFIPKHTEGVWRVDNRSMIDLNQWEISSLKRTLSDGPYARFNVRFTWKRAASMKMMSHSAAVNQRSLEFCKISLTTA
ncbi:unnamed protein product [Eruca vesicaria subsp. sativa]|uniref:Uncharacterized protein n=1 Tax=Eruca vesicaria subsp. sativa TaxID=29727 RepID=A0ABC8JA47_ERUVS|nr:unnamed protein product [Eruca vesicaria subsp. sativa]